QSAITTSCRNAPTSMPWLPSSGTTTRHSTVRPRRAPPAASRPGPARTAARSSSGCATASDIGATAAGGRAMFLCVRRWQSVKIDGLPFSQDVSMTATLDSAALAQYLVDHPQFFEEYAGLLGEI